MGAQYFNLPGLLANGLGSAKLFQAADNCLRFEAELEGLNEGGIALRVDKGFNRGLKDVKGFEPKFNTGQGAGIGGVAARYCLELNAGAIDRGSS